MSNYNTNRLKILVKIVLFFFILTSEKFSFEPKVDWTKPLQRCWERSNLLTETIASDNEQKPNSFNSIFSFSSNYVKNVSTYNGKVIWENNLQGDITSNLFFIKNRIYFFTKINKSEATEILLNSIDYRSGLLEWQNEFPPNSELLSDGENIFILIKNKELIKIDGSNGSIILKQEFENKVQTISSTYRDIFFQDELKQIIQLNNDFILSYLNFKLDLEIQIFDQNYNSIKNQFTVIISKNKQLIIYNKELKKEIWKRKIGGKISNMTIYENIILVTSLDNFVYLFELNTGKQILKKRLDGRITGKISSRGKLSAISAKGSQSIFLFDLETKRQTNYILLSDADLFVESLSLQPDFLIITTPNKIIAFSPNCP